MSYARPGVSAVRRVKNARFSKERTNAALKSKITTQALMHFIFHPYEDKAILETAQAQWDKIPLKDRCMCACGVGAGGLWPATAPAEAAALHTTRLTCPPSPPTWIIDTFVCCCYIIMKYRFSVIPKGRNINAVLWYISPFNLFLSDTSITTFGYQILIKYI